MRLFRYYLKKSTISVVAIMVAVVSSSIFFYSNGSYYTKFPIESESEFEKVQENFLFTEMMSGVYTSSNDEIRESITKYYVDRSEYSEYQNNIIDEIISVEDYKGEYDYFNIGYFTTEVVDLTNGFKEEMNRRIESNMNILTAKELKTFDKMKKAKNYEEWVSYLESGDNTNILKLVDFNEIGQFYDDLNFLLFYNTDYEGYLNNVNTFDFSKEFSLSYIEFTSATLSIFIVIFVVFNNLRFNNPSVFTNNSILPTKSIFFSKVLAYITFFMILMFVQLIIHILIMKFKILELYEFDFVDVIIPYIASLGIAIFTIVITEFACILLKKIIISIPIILAIQFATLGEQLKLLTITDAYPRYIAFETDMNYKLLIDNRLVYLFISIFILYLTYKICDYKRNGI